MMRHDRFTLISAATFFLLCCRCYHNPPEAKLPANSVGKIFLWPISNSTQPDWIAQGFTPRWKPSADHYEFHHALDLLPRQDGLPMAQKDICNNPQPVHAVTRGWLHQVHCKDSTDTSCEQVNGYKDSGNVVILRHKVDESMPDPPAGKLLEKDRYYTVYSHLRDLNFCNSTDPMSKNCLGKDVNGNGFLVEQGTVIGYVGNAANDYTNCDKCTEQDCPICPAHEANKEVSCFNHLHFEVRGLNYLFYAVNPLKYLNYDRTTNNDVPIPKIIPSEQLPGCKENFDPVNPMFWVSYEAHREQLDIDQIFIKVDAEGLANFSYIGFVTYNSRWGMGWYEDLDDDGQIEKLNEEYNPNLNPRTASYLETEFIVNKCTVNRNVFSAFQATNLTMDVQFRFSGSAEKDADSLTGTVSSGSVWACVCDIYDQCRDATPIRWKTNRSGDDLITEFSTFEDDRKCGVPWTVLGTTEGFENGWGTWIDGGADADRVDNASYAHGGKYTAEIRANSGAASSLYTKINLSKYENLQVDFWYYPRSMETGEGFFVELWSGSAWQVIGSYVVGTDFANDTMNKGVVKIDSTSFVFSSAAELRFRANASTVDDWVHIDDVTIAVQPLPPE